MRLHQAFGKTIDLLHAMRQYRRLAMRERASRVELLAAQTDRLNRFLRYAAEHSPFYRRRWGNDVPGAADLSQLEPLNRPTVVEHFDQLVTDRSLTRELLYAQLGSKKRGAYVVLATSGTTGEPMVVPYSRAAWRTTLAFTMRLAARRRRRFSEGLADGRRLATVFTRNPVHGTTQALQCFDPTGRGQLRLSAAAPSETLTTELERFRPTAVAGYPSVIDLLARAQQDGRLNIAPRMVAVTGEALPAGLRHRVADAWGSELFDTYGSTETMATAGECYAHTGMHIEEDAVIVEVVDDENRVLPPGTTGSAVLVTCLLNETLPLIRYRIDDVVRVDDAP